MAALTFNADGLRQSIRQHAAQAGARAAVSMQTQLRANFGVHRKSGDTQRATRVVLESTTATTITYRAEARTPQAVFTNDGTRAHIITPKRNPGAVLGSKWPRYVRGEPLLVFDWPKAGMFPARFRWVDHPGYSGSGWWDAGLAMWPDFVARYW